MKRFVSLGLAAIFSVAMAGSFVACEVDDENGDATGGSEDTEGGEPQIAEGCEPYLNCCIEGNMDIGGYSQAEAESICEAGILDQNDKIKNTKEGCENQLEIIKSTCPKAMP